jgi:lipopolysaccharide export system permease protein
VKKFNYKLQVLDWYIIRKFLSTFFFTLAIFLAIAVVFDFSEKVDDFIEKKAPLSAILFDYYMNFIPHYAGMLSPLLIFIGAVFFTAKMANNTEIVAILSGGISFKRLLYPYFVTAIFLSVLSFTFNAYLIPLANKTRIEFENRYVNNPYVYKERNIHLQIDDHTYVYLESYNNKSNVGYRFSLEKIYDKQLAYKLMSDRISWDSTKKEWRINNYSIRYINGLKEQIVRGEVKDTILNMSPTDFERKDNRKEALTLPELNEYIESEQKRGAAGFEDYIVEKYKRFALPFSTFILILIAVALCSRKVRGGIGVQLGIGIGSSFVYILLMQFTTTFATKGGLHPLIAVWIPNIIFGIYGFYLLKIAPK